MATQAETRFDDFVVKDLGLADFGRKEIEIAETEMPGLMALRDEFRAAMAAAAWSWVEKMLHDAQRTSAPSAINVSISTAV